MLVVVHVVVAVLVVDYIEDESRVIASKFSFMSFFMKVDIIFAKVDIVDFHCLLI